MIKTALIIGGGYAVGAGVGGKVASTLGFTSDAAVSGTKIATGVLAAFLLASVLR